ncbi:MAG: DUF4349 domain-containing protein [Candidatus Peribacteraceae bacterium]|nr:DUF4349 domain-containing protein [Candidatus Peribacteraceae bacterium]
MPQSPSSSSSLSSFVDRIVGSFRGRPVRSVLILISVIVAVALVMSVLKLLEIVPMRTLSESSVTGVSGQAGYGYAEMDRYAGNEIAGRDGAYAVTDTAKMQRTQLPSAPPSEPTTGAPDNRKVIRNGSLSLYVKDAAAAVSAIATIAQEKEGFVDQSNVYEVREGVRNGSITIRVPSVSFDEAREAIKLLAIKVLHEVTTSSDVTAQFVDLEAQLKNLRAEETQYVAIMKNAVKIDDVLKVASQLASVRGRIEQSQGQMNYLSRQIEMSTITVELTAEEKVEVTGFIWRPWTVVKQEAQDLLKSLAGFADFLIAFVFTIPVLVIKVVFWLIVLGIVWKIGRMLWRVVRRL